MKSEAEAVTNIGNVFNGNTDIVSFNELKDFIGLTYIAGGGFADAAFRYCSALESVTIPKNVIEIRSYAFSYCTALSEV